MNIAEFLKQSLDQIYNKPMLSTSSLEEIKDKIRKAEAAKLAERRIKTVQDLFSCFSENDSALVCELFTYIRFPDPKDANLVEINVPGHYRIRAIATNHNYFSFHVFLPKKIERLFRKPIETEEIRTIFAFNLINALMQAEIK